MRLEEAMSIWQAMQSAHWPDLRQDLIDVAVRYARIRVDWLLAEPEKQREMETDRTATHNALIAACDCLARNMARKGEDATWRRELGDDRKRIGDFACCLHCLLGLGAR